MTADRKITFALNVTLDGYTDHTVGIADDELHDFFAQLLEDADLILFGRVTYQLMASYWPHAENDPEAAESMKRFAKRYNALPKIVFSRTLRKAEWYNSRIERGSLVDQVLKLKQQPGKNVLISGISIFQELMRHNLIDEYWLLVHPVIWPKGKRLFDDSDSHVNLALVETRTFASGVVVLHYLKNS